MPEIDELPSGAGIHDCRMRLASGAELRYTLRLPPAASGAPLVLVLHYGGTITPYYGRPLLEGLVVPALQSVNAVMVAPEALGGDWTSAANEAALLELVAAIERGHATDPARRLITGYSLGAIGTWHLIARHPTLFAAAIPIAGAPPATIAILETPVYAIHSDADLLFSLAAVRAQVETLPAAGARVTLAVMNGIDHYDVFAARPALSDAAAWLERQWRSASN